MFLTKYFQEIKFNPERKPKTTKAKADNLKVKWKLKAVPSLRLIFVSCPCIIMEEKAETCFLPATEPSWTSRLRDTLGLDLKDEGDRLLLALEEVGVGKKIESETRGKHLVQGGILELA